MRAPQENENMVGWDKLSASIGQFDLASRHATVAEVRFDGPHLFIRRERNGQLSLASLMRQAAPPQRNRRRIDKHAFRSIPPRLGGQSLLLLAVEPPFSSREIEREVGENSNSALRSTLASSRIRDARSASSHRHWIGVISRSFASRSTGLRRVSQGPTC
jgi:hypothetical protein